MKEREHNFNGKDHKLVISPSLLERAKEVNEDKEYVIFTKDCDTCKKEYRLNIPRHYFNEKGEVNSKSLPDGVTAEMIEDSIKRATCENCKDKNNN